MDLHKSTAKDLHERHAFGVGWGGVQEGEIHGAKLLQTLPTEKVPEL